MRIVLPPELGRRAAEVAAGRQDAVDLAPAATVVLLRDAPGGGTEAYLQRRHRGLAFAGGKYAFPGGRVDPADAEPAADVWHGASPQQWAATFGVDSPHVARAHVVAVVRELFEETGVLLCVPDPSATGARAVTEADRAQVGDGLPLADLLRDLGCRLDADALRAWSRWLTPRFETRRFDTWFFVAALPPGQQPRVATSESHEGRWVAPQHAGSMLSSGELPMLPPTWWTLAQLARYETVAHALAERRDVVRYTVGWAKVGDDAVMVLPDDDRYPGDDPREGT